MTSSLVGSEMCIRDRCTCMHRCKLGDCGGGGGARGVGWGWCPSGWGNNPVSYTHLTLPTICSV
eukprot:683957-Prorocentrum_lima.AAC.1